MASKIIMPKQGLQMTEGMITAWLKQVGDRVELDEPLFEMETDKLAITINSTAAGTLLAILHPENDTVAITETIAIIGEPGEDYANLLNDANGAEAPEKPAEEIDAKVSEKQATACTNRSNSVLISPRAKRIANERNLDYSGIVGSGPEGMIVERDLEGATSAGAAASPLAKKLAQLNHVDLNTVSGSGFRGKVMADDIRGLCAKETEVPVPAAAVAARGERVEKHSGMRKVIAKRMCSSLQTMAQANHRISVDMTEAVRIREQYKRNNIRISYNDIILRCAARALQDCPYMNASFTEDTMIYKEYVHLGVAVALDDGLVVPVIRDADLMTLETLAATSKDLAARARENKLSMDELSGSTFSVTNLGMMDIDEFTPIINPPEVGILGVGKMEKRVVVLDDDTTAIRPYLRLSLTYDHRAVDGAPAAKFLQRLKKLLENPLLLL